MDTLASDLRQAARALARRPGFLAVAVLTLALGIGANTALFSVVHAVLLRPLPYQDPERLVSIVHLIPLLDAELVGGADFIAWRDGARTLSAVTAYSATRFTLTGGEQPERVRGARVSANFLSMLGLRPERGRDFRKEEERLNAGRVALVGRRLWDRLYGARGDVQEPGITLNGTSYTVIGVLPRDFQFPGESNIEVLLPFTLDETVESRRESMTLLNVIGRLAPGVSIPQVHAELEVIRKRSEEEAARAAAARPPEPPPALPPGFEPPPGFPLPGGAPPAGGGGRQMRRMVVQGGPGAPGGAPAGPPGGGRVVAPGGPRGPGGPGSGAGRPPAFLQDLVLEITPLRDKIVGDVRPALLVL
ncbi:MAG TPA: ABC transporter permease, partial [Thermoanaerobaculia bacterium]|nr:ABC transporter permease [Thermoanaerobaculia bacterium]